MASSLQKRRCVQQKCLHHAILRALMIRNSAYDMQVCRA
jgi:hypothetical protein